jgi:hypothetical protein
MMSMASQVGSNSSHWTEHSVVMLRDDGFFLDALTKALFSWSNDLENNAMRKMIADGFIQVDTFNICGS